MKITIQRYTVLKTILLVSFIILPLLGSNCNNTNTVNTGNISGTWRLDFVQGNLQDVCFGEVVNFPSNTGGTATLTCPQQSSISRAYTFSGDVLTYTDTGVQYTVNSGTSGVLILTGTFTAGGTTNTRILTYRTSTMDKSNVTSPVNQNSGNSSEQILSK